MKRLKDGYNTDNQTFLYRVDACQHNNKMLFLLLPNQVMDLPFLLYLAKTGSPYRDRFRKGYFHHIQVQN